MATITCIECDGRGNTWYGSRSVYTTCEICGGTGYLNDRGGKTPDARATPLWPEHDQCKLDNDLKKYRRF